MAAQDLTYWQTHNYEWCDPDAVTTKDGNLEITLSEQPIHDLNFRSGFLTSWNKFCFNKDAYIEINCSLPGNAETIGLWPGLWTMGNLGRAGFGATNDGTWPYSYEVCDVGTLPNQTFPNGTSPIAAKESGERDYGGELSYLPGQRLSGCTCRGDDHPGPSTSVGRAAPEIDILEAQVDYHGYGTASQSVQIAPFDSGYYWE
jgi:beta-glucanase (GH16 family)